MIRDGDKAPAFTLPGEGGDIVKLGDFKGRIVVVYFYPKDDTEGCTKQAVGFSQLLPAFHEIGAEVIGISPDSVKSHGKFRAKHDLRVVLLADEDRKAIEAYGVWGEKKMYGRTFMGVIRSTFLIGKNGKVARAWHNVKVPGHAEEVLAAARDLAAV
jgi:peroxiredoxin Q/BCP